MICRLEPSSLRWLDLSESLATFMGRSLEQLAHQTFTQYVHQDDRDPADDEFRQVCELGERYDLVLRLKSGRGQWRYMRISAQARYEPDGRVDHIRCNFRDVTESVHAEHELRRRTVKLNASNAQLRKINQRLEKTTARLIQFSARQHVYLRAVPRESPDPPRQAWSQDRPAAHVRAAKKRRAPGAARRLSADRGVRRRAFRGEQSLDAG